MINKPVKLSFKFIIRQTLKVFRISFWLFVITTVVFLITLNLSFVKSLLSVKVIDYLSEQTGYQLSFEDISISWFDHVELDELKIYDLEDKPMLGLNGVNIDFDLVDLIVTGQVNIDHINIEGGDINISKYPKESTPNIQQFLYRLKLLIGSSKSDTSYQRKLSIASLKFSDLTIAKHEWGDTSDTSSLFDPKHIIVDVKEAHIKDLFENGDRLTMDILKFKAKEKCGFEIKKMNGQLTLTDNDLWLNDLTLATNNSRFGSYFHVSYDDMKSLFSLNNLYFDVEFENNHIDFQDAVYFFGNVIPDSTFDFSLKLKGTVPDLSFDYFQVNTKERLKVQGSGVLIGLPNIYDTFMDVNVEKGFISSTVTELLGRSSIGNIHFSGDFAGFVTDFNVDAEFITKKGTIVTHVNLKSDTDLIHPNYKGYFALEKFDLGWALNNSIFGNIDFEGEVHGCGIDLNSSNFQVSGMAHDTEFNGYAYDSLLLEGSYDSGLFNGGFNINDPHCQIKGKTTINIMGSIPTINSTIDINTLHLSNLNFSSDPFNVEGKAFVNLENLQLDDLVGTIKLNDAVLSSVNGEQKFDNVSLFSSYKDSIKVFEVTSRNLSAKFFGDFKPTVLINDLPQIARSYINLITKSREELELMDTYPQLDTQSYYQCRMNLEMLEINSLFKLFDVPIRVSNGTVIDMHFRKTHDISLSLYGRSDTIKYKDHLFLDTELDVNASKDIKNPEVLAIIQLFSSEQQWDEIDPTRDFFMESIWLNNKIDSEIALIQDSTKSRFNLMTVAEYVGDSIRLRLKPTSKIEILGNTWTVDPGNEINIMKNIFEVQKMAISNEGQKLGFDGKYASGSTSTIEFFIEDFDIKNISPIIPVTLGGIINSRGKISQNKSNGLLKVVSDLNIQNLDFDGFIAGNLKGRSLWNTSSDAIKMKFTLQREDINTIDLTGSYYPYKENDNIDVQVKFEEAKIDVLQPFLSKHLANIDGALSGMIKIGGKIFSPTIAGQGTLSEGSFFSKLTNIPYNINGPIRFDSYEIFLNGLEIKDDLNGLANLTGHIYHHNLADIKTDIGVELKSIQLLNTTGVDNQPYFGRAIGSGHLEINGPLSNPRIRGELTTEQGTSIGFPIDHSVDVSEKEFITFLDPKTKKVKKEIEKGKKKTYGISVDIDFNITPSAYIELINNAQSGDVVRARMDGDLQFSMDPQGNIKLFGLLEVADGAYNFTIPGINKEFRIKKGGTITWDGNPYEGIIDLSATYKQLAALSDWDEVVSTSVKIPFLVVLDLKGTMHKPQIKLRIETSENLNTITGNNSQALRRFLITTNDREDELNRQVFSLLMFRRLSPQNSFQIGQVNKGITSSVSELLANQLSYWISNSNENLELDIDLGGLDEEAFNSIQYRLAYTFLNGRLKVSGGNSAGSDADLSLSERSEPSDRDYNLIDNWSVEYLLTPEGNIRVKIFSKMNQTFLTSTAQNNQQEGFSLRLSKSFDRPREIFKRNRN